MSLIYTHLTSRNNLYLSGKDDAKSLSKLQQRNVRRVLNVTPAKVAGITAGVPNYFEGKVDPVGYKIQYKRIPVYSTSTFLIGVDCHELMLIGTINVGYYPFLYFSTTDVARDQTMA